MPNRILDISSAKNLLHEGVADQGSYGVVPYVSYNGSTNYSHRPAGPLKGINGFTAGGWFQMTSSDFLMGVWQTAANQVWRLFVNGSIPTFYVSSTGANSFSVASSTIVAGEWYSVVARYTPSTDISIWLNGVKATNTSSIPASLFNSTSAEFTIGADHAAASKLTGKASMCWVSSEPLPDDHISLLYLMSRSIYSV